MLLNLGVGQDSNLHVFSTEDIFDRDGTHRDITPSKDPVCTAAIPCQLSDQVAGLCLMFYQIHRELGSQVTFRTHTDLCLQLS